MVPFFIPAATTAQYHPAIRKDMLDISFQKLQSIKQAQRVAHRPVNLHKTVLVYNTFKAVLSMEPPPTNKLPTEGCTMDVDKHEAVVAEQMWFDNCIDSVSMDEDTEKDELSLSEEVEDEYAVEEVASSNPIIVTPNATGFDAMNNECILKPSLSSSTFIHSYGFSYTSPKKKNLTL